MRNTANHRRVVDLPAFHAVDRCESIALKSKQRAVRKATPMGTNRDARVYWSNKATGLVNDVPGEIMVQPNLWGDGASCELRR